MIPKGPAPSPNVLVNQLPVYDGKKRKKPKNKARTSKGKDVKWM